MPTVEQEQEQVGSIFHLKLDSSAGNVIRHGPWRKTELAAHNGRAESVVTIERSAFKLASGELYQGAIGVEG